MADGNPKGPGGHTVGILSGIAAAATALAAIAGLLSQFGIIGNHVAPNTIVVAATPVSQSSVAPVQVASAPSAAPSAPASSAQVADTSALHHKHRLRHEIFAAPPASAAEVPGAASSTMAMTEPAGPSHIAGAWRDIGLGACHLINQLGSQFEVINYDAATGEVRGHGRGMISGNHVEILYPRRAVTLDLHVSPDGHTLEGKIFRLNSTHPARWNYIGTDCSKRG
jgi:hypothetical protein